MQLGSLQYRYRDAAERIQSREPFDQIGRAETILKKALWGEEKDVGKVMAAARCAIFLLYTDLTGRYAPPSEVDEYLEAISEAVLAVVPAGEVLGPVQAANLLETHRQTLPIWTRLLLFRRHFTPLWRNGRRVFLRAELLAIRAGEEPPYGATV